MISRILNLFVSNAFDRQFYCGMYHSQMMSIHALYSSSPQPYFRRSFTLPENAKEENITASLNNGVLNVIV